MFQSMQQCCSLFSRVQKIKQLSTLGVLSLSLLAGASVSAETERGLVVFGHNPYEQGNFPALVGVLDNTFSGENGNRIGTGPSIGDVISRELLAGNVISEASQAALFSGQGNNYAVATAATRVREDALSPLIGLQAQVNTYTASVTPSEAENNLYVYAPGQNDVLDAVGTGQFPLLSCEFKARKYRHVYRKTHRLGGDYKGHFEGTEYERVAEIMYSAINASTDQLDQLQSAGAQDILIPNVTSPALFPVLGQIAGAFGCSVEALSDKADTLTKQFNRAIKRYVKRSDNQEMQTYNIQRDVRALQNNAAAFGFSDITNNCYLVDVSVPQIFLNPQVECNDTNENTFLHYTALTLTADADDFIGRKMAATLRLMAR